jgi:hypothetical protein
MLRDKNGKFIKSEHWDDRERSDIVARLAQGWLRSLERLHGEAVKLRRVPHGRHREEE